MKDKSALAGIKRVAVIPFKCNSGDFGTIVSDSVTANMLESRFDFIERSQLNKILEEQKLVLDKVIDNPELLFGRIKGIDALVIGSVNVEKGFAGLAYGGNVQYVANASARIVNVNDGSLLAMSTFTSSNASTWTGKYTASDVGEELAKELLNCTRK